ncbi:MAG: hypothetical protein DMG80_10735 [Acidobacteria bacterium]|jgi:hypothetical protein|nr:MAG: hypothetical protein DMG80_10735 [Acidobacteriota bacterium]
MWATRLKGLSAGAGANADVISASQTLKLGPMTLSATGNVGIGAEASATLSPGTGQYSASAGLTAGFGGAVSISFDFGPASASAGASMQSNSAGTVETKVDEPKLDTHPE